VECMSVLKEFIEAIFRPISGKSWKREGKKNYESLHLRGLFHKNMRYPLLFWMTSLEWKVASKSKFFC